MATPPLTDEACLEAVQAVREFGSQSAAARGLGIPRPTLRNRLRRAAERGLDGSVPTALPPGQVIKGVSTLYGEDGSVRAQWVKAETEKQDLEAAMRAAVDAFKDELPRATPVDAPHSCNDDLLNQFTVTDVHLGCLAWSEETGGDDYDLKIAEQLLMDWFTAAIRMAPDAGTAIFAQLGDLLHHDSHLSVTPTSHHVLDADSRFQKMVRVAIRCCRSIVKMLLQKHSHVHIIMADDNHSPASAVWLREMFSAFFEDEPRISVDSSASTYYTFEHGDVSLFYHHGHRRKIKDIDSVFAGQFRDIFGRTKYSYAHLGHLHSDELKSTNLMKVERHETLAARDAYAANGGWISGRSAKVITYHKRFGEVSRITLSPEMVTRRCEAA